MSFPDSSILAELVTQPVWEKDTSGECKKGAHAYWAGTFMSIDYYENIYYAHVSFHLHGEGGWFFKKEKKTLRTAKEACFKAAKEKYRLMLEVDAEKQQALCQSNRISTTPDHLRGET